MPDVKSIPGYIDVWGYNYASNLNRNRWRLLLDFIDFDLNGKALDIGERNPFTEQIEQRFHIKIDDTGMIDLDIVKLQGRYKTIFCFEVLEHLMNPLFFMRNCYEVLENHGRMFLSTPLKNPDFLQDNETHFKEYRPKELQKLFDRAGFHINRLQVVKHIPKSWIFKGIRPALRYFIFGRNIQIELQKL